MRKTHKPSDRPTHVVDLLEHAHRSSPSEIITKPGSIEGFINKQIPKAIQGREAVLSAAISMIKTAINESVIKGKCEILLTLQSEREHFDGYPKLYSYWQDTIIQALDSGWNIKQLCKLNKNVGRSLKLVNQIMDWTNYPGTYSLYYFNKYGILNPPFEIILVEGKCALLCFAAENPSEIDSAIYIDDIGSVQVIEKFTKMMLLEVEPLVRTLELEEYFELNAAKDHKSGNHLLVYQDLNFITVPYPLMEKYIKITIPDQDERKIHLKRIADCLQSFNRDIIKHKMCHIYPMRAFEHLIMTGEHVKNSYFRPTPVDIKLHLEHLIGLLKRHKGFEVALVSDNQYELLNQAEWEIKGDHTITIGVTAKNAGNNNVALLTITEGTILAAFQESFWDLWERIIPIHRDKAFVISWLEERMMSI
ncbi:hypothetical protein EHS13_34540 [Paenibacillus psychroresistens]|uniref:Uncharacterized protein n=1 Tax=Paenibacillus psychroresistens TaxID=1778678 RepID=A0A6B8RUV7_9BACL|nr:hypothetical protein [Paenibacillus psychroresistens]QGQ99622.1 hypothetical protein EHS13_34540 [Paenibacillus psychroresistens]